MTRMTRKLWERRILLYSQWNRLFFNPNELRYVQSISFPGSGHHLLLDILLRYFSRCKHYPLTHGMNYRKSVLYAGDFAYCESYQHCQNRPCTNQDVKFQKNHDFPIHFPLGKVDDTDNSHSKDTPILVQYRKDHRAAISSYKKRFLSENHHVTTEMLETYWQNFSSNWIETENKNIVQIAYEDLLNQPLQMSSQAIQLFHDQDVDYEFLESVIDSVDLKLSM